MDVFHMTYMRNAIFHKLKKQQKHPVYEDKSDTRRKVVKVRGTLIKMLMVLCTLFIHINIIPTRPKIHQI